jgi:hypothetical protein
MFYTLQYVTEAQSKLLEISNALAAWQVYINICFNIYMLYFHCIISAVTKSNTFVATRAKEQNIREGSNGSPSLC